MGFGGGIVQLQECGSFKPSQFVVGFGVIECPIPVLCSFKPSQFVVGSERNFLANTPDGVLSRASL